MNMKQLCAQEALKYIKDDMCIGLGGGSTVGYLAEYLAKEGTAKKKSQEFMSELTALENVDIDDRRMLRVEAIIQSMTKRERQNPSIINASRKKRIAAGSGNSVQEVNQLLRQFEQMQKMMKQFSGGGLGRMIKRRKRR